MKNESDTDLIKRAKALHWEIFVEEVWSTHGLLEYEAVCRELENRGYRLAQSLEAIKEEPEEEEQKA